MDPPVKPGSLAPNLSRDGDTVLLTWLEPPHPKVKPQEGNYALRFSRFEQGRWSAPATIASGTDFFANWADFPSVTASSDGRLLIAHWAAKSGSDTYAYDVRLARSEDRGRSWTPMGPAHDDRTKTEHGFVSAVPEERAVRLFWLDGRATATKGPMALRTARVERAIGPSELLDPKVCDCCQTGAAGTSGGFAVVYRDRSDREVRDISVVRGTSGRWSAPRTVFADGWQIDGCPVNGPAIDADGDLVAAAWFSQAQDRPRIEVAFSKDGAATFGHPFALDAAEPLGRVDVAIDGRGDAIVAWVASVPPKDAAIRLVRVSPNGRIGAPVTVAPTSTARASGFPRIERAGDRLVVVWVEANEPSRLRAAVLPLTAL